MPNFTGTTSNAALTTIGSVTLPEDSVCIVEAIVAARRTGGSAGTTGDSAGYIRKGVFKRVGTGNAAIVGAVTADHTGENQSGWDTVLAVSGTSVEARVTGAANNDISWVAAVSVYRVYPVTI